MILYQHRKEPEYLRVVRERLSISGKNGIESKSVKIAKPFIRDGTTYDRCCRIDIAGFAATTLFDDGGSFSEPSVADSMRQIFENASELNARGIFVKMRILLVYPYSAYAFSRIQAEATANRSSIAEPIYPRNLDIVESVDQTMFFQSRLFSAQTHVLNQLQEWIDYYKWDRKTLNRANLRFIPTCIDFCLLVINDTAFIDPYLQAKTRRARKECALLGPLVQIDQTLDKETFEAIDDHFRYIWDLDLAIYCQDGTNYQPGVPRSMGQIKIPSSITFDSKATNILEKKPDLTEDQVTRWKYRMGRVLKKYCMEPSPVPGPETLFITCSWSSEFGQATPNEYAIELSAMLESDFGRRRSVPLLSVFIMEGVAGEFFTEQLYKRLDESTLGLVLLTADIESSDGKKFSRPNVYHELGYLMKHLGPGRIAIVCENGVTVPSNIHDVIRIDYSSHKLILAYTKIAGWVFRSTAFSAALHDEIERNITLRLDKNVNEKLITVDESKLAKQKIRNQLHHDSLSYK